MVLIGTVDQVETLVGNKDKEQLANGVDKDRIRRSVLEVGGQGQSDREFGCHVRNVDRQAH